LQVNRFYSKRKRGAIDFINSFLKSPDYSNFLFSDTQRFELSLILYREMQLSMAQDKSTFAQPTYFYLAEDIMELFAGRKAKIMLIALPV